MRNSVVRATSTFHLTIAMTGRVYESFLSHVDRSLRFNQSEERKSITSLVNFVLID